jgi:hypothetical protein
VPEHATRSDPRPGEVVREGGLRRTELALEGEEPVEERRPVARERRLAGDPGELPAAPIVVGEPLVGLQEPAGSSPVIGSRRRSSAAGSVLITRRTWSRTTRACRPRASRSSSSRAPAGRSAASATSRPARRWSRSPSAGERRARSAVGYSRPAPRSRGAPPGPRRRAGVGVQHHPPRAAPREPAPQRREQRPAGSPARSRRRPGSRPRWAGGPPEGVGRRPVARRAGADAGVQDGQVLLEGAELGSGTSTSPALPGTSRAPTTAAPKCSQTRSRNASGASVTLSYFTSGASGSFSSPLPKTRTVA